MRDHLLKRYPRMTNESGCPELAEGALIEQELALEQALDVQFPIDLVYTWVDGSDEQWREKYADFVGVAVQSVPSANDAARFHSHDELRYSLFSTLSFMPWVRRVFVVTDDQCPSWWKPHDKLHLIHHTDIIEAKFLPTFNSHVIEAHLHKIAGLSEHFIYFNDDVLAARSLPASHFFQTNGLASLFLSLKSLNRMNLAGQVTPTLLASGNSRRLILQTHGVDIDRPLVHSYVPLRRSVLDALWTEYADAIQAFLPNRIRGENDLNLATFLGPWSAYLRGQATLKTDICHYFNVRSPAAMSAYETLLNRQAEGNPPHSICLNDFQSIGATAPGYDAHLARFLRNFYPECP